MIRNFNLLIVFVIVLLSINACKEDGVLYTESIDFPNEMWKLNDTVSFDFDVDDTVNLYDVFVSVRNNENYKWSNIYLFSDLEFPNGKTRTDTIEIILADEYGYWLGKTSGTYVITQSKYIRKRKFPLKGKYTIKFNHAMRLNDLDNVASIGIKIKQTDKK